MKSVLIVILLFVAGAASAQPPGRSGARPRGLLQLTSPSVRCRRPTPRLVLSEQGTTHAQLPLYGKGQSLRRSQLGHQ